MVDLDAEIAKCQKKLGLARLNLENLKKVVSQPRYADTVPIDVRLLKEHKVPCRFIWNFMPWLIH
jgi:valyl-tRNA synthetase